MALADTIGQYVPFLMRGKGSLPREQMLALRPVRNAAIAAEPMIDETSGPERLALRVPKREDMLGRVLSRLLSLPAERRIELDEFGSAVWRLCDGTRTVDSLVRYTCETYRLNRRQGEVSVVAFMRMLAQRRLIGLVKPDAKEPSTHATEKPRKQRQPNARARRRRF